MKKLKNFKENSNSFKKNLTLRENFAKLYVKLQ